MKSIDNLNLYLENIPGPLPQGKDVKYETVYDEIQEALREELDLPQGVWVKDIKSADWKKVESLCTNILMNQSKDLQIAAWLIKAWMFLYDVEGLQKGFELLFKLSEKYWDVAYPTLSAEDLEYRAAPYNWINEKLADCLNKIPITHPMDKEASVCTFSSYIDTHYMSDIKEVRPGSTTPPNQDKRAADLKASIKKTDLVFFESLKEFVKEAKDTIQKLQKILDEKMGKVSPSLYRMRDKLDQFNQYADMVLIEKKAEQATKEASKKAVTAIQLEPVHEEGKTSLQEVIHGRAEAYAMIEKAVDYLSKLDPHSPAPYLIKRAVRWGTLSFDDLLKEMVADPNSLADLRRLLGVANINAGGAPTSPTALSPSASPGVNTPPIPPKPFWSVQE